MPAAINPSDIERLQWQCRRGMLELDYLLRDFLDVHYAALDQAEKRVFVRLLDYSDQILHGWLMGHSVPREQEIRGLVARIRATRH